MNVINNIGDSIVLGTYANEPLTWTVIDIKDDKALVLTEKIFEAKMFDRKSNNYEKSAIRAWLNKDFYKNAFKDDEKKQILITEVDNSINSVKDKGNMNVCPNTKDYIFLLSQLEAEACFDTEAKRKATGTANAVSNGLEVKDGTASWWLRSPDFMFSGYAYSVGPEGHIYSIYYTNETTFGVRAACWIKK